MKTASCNSRVNTRRRIRLLLIIIASPTTNRAINAQRARMVAVSRTIGQFCERPVWSFGLPVAVVAPAVDSRVCGEPAGMQPPCRQHPVQDFNRLCVGTRLFLCSGRLCIHSMGTGCERRVAAILGLANIASGRQIANGGLVDRSRRFGLAVRTVGRTASASDPEHKMPAAHICRHTAERFSVRIRLSRQAACAYCSEISLNGQNELMHRLHAYLLINMLRPASMLLFHTGRAQPHPRRLSFRQRSQSPFVCTGACGY